MTEEKSLVAVLAGKVGMDKEQYWNAVAKTVMPGQVSTEQMMVFLAVAKEYNLNPLTREIYAFPKEGGIQAITGVDGWLKIANRQSGHDGIETEEIMNENGEVIAVKALIHNRHRRRPTTATEYMSECKRNTGPWKQWPIRMLTNKAIIQAIRRAYSISGLVDPDEGERIKEVDYVDVSQEHAEATKAKISNMIKMVEGPEDDDPPAPDDEPEVLDVLIQESPPEVEDDGLDGWACLEGDELRNSVYLLAKMTLKGKRAIKPLQENPNATDEDYRELARSLGATEE